MTCTICGNMPCTCPQSGLDKRRYVIDDEVGIQLALNCSDCGGRPVVYGITYPLPPHIPEGQYCYQCLLARCIKAKAVPFPIPANLLDKLRHDIKTFYTGLHKYHQRSRP